MHHRRRQGNMSSWRARPRVRKSQQEQVGNKSDLTLSLAVPCGPLRAARGPRPDASSTYSAVSCSDFISLKFFECVVLVRARGFRLSSTSCDAQRLDSPPYRRAVMWPGTRPGLPRGVACARHEDTHLLHTSARERL